MAKPCEPIPMPYAKINCEPNDSQVELEASSRNSKRSKKKDKKKKDKEQENM